MLDRIEIVKPADIEKRSMEIITEELNGRTWPEPEFSIVKRCIHTSADFEYADNLRFSEHAAMRGVEALRRGAVIVTDTKMAWSGINKKKLSEYGGRPSVLWRMKMWQKKRRKGSVPGQPSAWNGERRLTEK